MNDLNIEPLICELDLPDERLPDPDNLSYYVLEKDRKLFLEGDVDENNSSIVRMIYRWNMEDKGIPAEDRKPIKIFIMSPGGRLDYMWMLINAIEMSVTPVYTINIGMAASAASLIFISGKKRYMMPYAQVIIHEGSAQLSGDAVKVMDASDSYRKDLARMKQYILSHTEIPSSTLTRKKNNDWTLDADTCLSYKVCHHIINNLDDVL